VVRLAEIECGIAGSGRRGHVVIDVAELRAALDRIESLGGTTVAPISEIPLRLHPGEGPGSADHVVGLALP
jgi:predicted enzyme related to lactoylglutathione lyase